MKRKFLITDEQIEQLRPYMPNIDQLVNGDPEPFQFKLDDIILSYFDENDMPSKTSIFLQNIYDDIYNQNN